MDIRYDYYNDSSGRNVKHFLLANLPKINGTTYGNSQQTAPLIPPLPQGEGCGLFNGMPTLRRSISGNIPPMRMPRMNRGVRKNANIGHNVRNWERNRESGPTILLK